MHPAKHTGFASATRVVERCLASFLALIILGVTGISAAQTNAGDACRTLLKLAGTPPNVPPCLSSYEIFNLEAVGWGKKVKDLVESNTADDITAPKSGACNLVGLSLGPNLRRQGAIASYEKQGCDCQIVIDDGRVESFALLNPNGHFKFPHLWSPKFP